MPTGYKEYWYRNKQVEVWLTHTKSPVLLVYYICACRMNSLYSFRCISVLWHQLLVCVEDLIKPKSCCLMIKDIRYAWKIRNDILGIVTSQFQHLEFEVEKKCQYYKVCLIEELRHRSYNSLKYCDQRFSRPGLSIWY